MAFNVTAINEALTGLLGDGTTDKNNFVSLHTADPGTTGASELVGGAYARVATNWTAAAAGETDGSTVTINVPAGNTITHWGMWDAATNGNFKFGGTLPANETFGSNGTYAVTPTVTAS